jgi:hypothetical protein
MISGEYGDIHYIIEHKNHPLLGAYYDIRLMIEEKIKVHEREMTLVRAMDTLVKSLKTWTLDEEIIIVAPEKAQKLIEKWDDLNHRMRHEDWLSDDESRHLVIEMLPILMQLRGAGYEVTDDGEWYHPSEAN